MAFPNLKELYPDLAEFTDDELLKIQESMLSDLQRGRVGRGGGNSMVYANKNTSQIDIDEAFARALAANDDINGYEVDGYHRSSNVQVSQRSWGGQGAHGADDDEALARALQAELNLGDTHTPGSSHQPANFGGGGSGGSHNFPVDNIDPDRMTYEELNSLGDSMGHEKKGVSVDFISQLPTFPYKAPPKVKVKVKGGLLSKKKAIDSSSSSSNNNNECIICKGEYADADKLLALPCAHHFHSDCITPWLLENKNCPICQKEVK